LTENCFWNASSAAAKSALTPMSWAFMAWKSASRASSPVISFVQGPLKAPMNV
jgi:hypothetical protein